MIPTVERTKTDTKILQSWSRQRGIIKNHTLFGSELAKFAKQNLPLVLSQYDFGWLDGACLIFAEALKRWSKNKILIAVIEIPSSQPIIDHAIGYFKIPQTDKYLCFDATGICTSTEFEQKWINTERTEFLSCRIATEVNPYYHLYSDPKMSQELSKRLKKRFGEFNENLILDAIQL